MVRRSARISRSTRSPSMTPAQPAKEKPSDLPALAEDRQPEPMDLDKGSDWATTSTSSSHKTPSKRQQKHADMPATVNMRTPKRKSTIQPARNEMHPAHHQTSCAKPLEEARWLGFEKMEPHTEPVRKNPPFVGLQDTPTKLKNGLPELPMSPEFQFTFRQPSIELSPTAKQMMAENREEAARIRAQMIADGEGPRELVTTNARRKIAQPKGKSGRFSDVHTQMFQKMDSIANHPSSFRADSSRVSPVKRSLKRTRSKVDFDAAEESRNGAQSKAPASESSASKKTKHELSADVHPNSTTATARREHGQQLGAQGKSHTIASIISGAPKPPSTIITPTANNPDEVARSLSSIPKAPSSIMTPTKSSLARFHSVKDLKTAPVSSTSRSGFTKNPSQSNIDKPRGLKSAPLKPSSVRKVSQEDIKTTEPRNTPHKPASVKIVRNIDDMPPEDIKTPTKPSRLTAQVGSSIKSILKGPSRLYSNDPVKIAAGTHTPAKGRISGAAVRAPATAPVHKHIRFTNSTIEREKAKASTPDARSASLVSIQQSPSSTRTVSYPSLDPSRLAEASFSPSKRASIAAPSIYDFTFRSDRLMTFGGPSTPTTIRHVESNHEPKHVGTLHKPTRSSAAKRKADVMDATPDHNKENRDQSFDEGEMRSAKRIKSIASTIAKTPTKTPSSRLPKMRKLGTPAKTGTVRSISRSRLDILATPKRRR